MRGFVVALGITVLVFIMSVAHATTAVDPHRYVLRGVDPDPWPAVVVFRHCGNAAEDSMSHLRMVEYVPGERIVYRCRAYGY